MCNNKGAYIHVHFILLYGHNSLYVDWVKWIINRKVVLIVVLLSTSHITCLKPQTAVSGPVAHDENTSANGKEGVQSGKERKPNYLHTVTQFIDLKY